MPQSYAKPREVQNKKPKTVFYLSFFIKKSPFSLQVCGKTLPLRRKTNGRAFLRSAKDIGVWCNGNTTDSGPVILGSSPSTPTGKKPIA